MIGILKRLREKAPGGSSAGEPQDARSACGHDMLHERRAIRMVCSTGL